MREIKFRIWNGKEMIYPFNPDQEDYVLGFYWFEENNIRTTEDLYKKILMQYTGIKDKNNKEIYEGDIVKHEFGVNVIEHGDIAVGLGIGFQLFDSEWYEVIGNIYQNQELLNAS